MWIARCLARSLRWIGTASAIALLAGAVAAPARSATPTARTGYEFAAWGDALANALSLDGSGAYHADRDPGSLYTVENALGVRLAWATRDRRGANITGQGVGVALLDSGVDQVPGLAGPNKVIDGPDLSIEENGVLTQQDTFGHGTFMAGIIAGRGTTAASSQLAKAGPSTQLGIAPDAELLAMKLATTDGSTDVSQVIAALDWVTEHPVLPDGTRIRVINLSYGTDSTQGYLADPLAAAVENAWHHGIVVVTSAGNEGRDANGLTDPAIDPYVIAVGAADNHDKLTGYLPLLTRVADYSSMGTSARHPDLIAPGTSLVSLRAPGSTVDRENPQGRVDGDASNTLFRGSGTSQAAAVVSGLAALILQAHPDYTPDMVKAALVRSSIPTLAASTRAAGAGLVSADGALVAANALTVTGLLQSLLGRGSTTQSFPVSTGQGSLQAARGGAVLVDADGNPLSGEVDVQGNAWSPQAWWSAASRLSSWSGGRWMGVVWTGDDWENGSSGFSSSRWSSAEWSSSRWSDADWSSSRWSSSRWSSSRWSSSRWSDADWGSGGTDGP